MAGNLEEVRELLSTNHWHAEEYKQRMTENDWRCILLNDADTITYRGRVRTLKAKKLGFGVVEVSKVPLEENDDNSGSV